MYSKFPFSMENLPRQKGFGCLSLKFGCIFSALIVILYTVFALAEWAAVIGTVTPRDPMATRLMLIVVGLVHFSNMILTTIMLIGTIRETYRWIKPWVVWTSCQMLVGLLLFIFWTTMNMIHHVEISLLIYIISFMELLVRFYMLVLVASYCKELEEEAGNERLKRLMTFEEPKYSAV